MHEVHRTSRRLRTIPNRRQCFGRSHCLFGFAVCLFRLQASQVVFVLLVLLVLPFTAWAALRRCRARREAARPKVATTRPQKAEKKLRHLELWSSLDGERTEPKCIGSAGSFDEWHTLWKRLRPDFDRRFARLQADNSPSPSMLHVALTAGMDGLPLSLSHPLSAVSLQDEERCYRFALEASHDCVEKWLKAAETVVHGGKHSHDPFCAKHPKLTGIGLQVWHRKVHLLVWPRSQKVPRSRRSTRCPRLVVAPTGLPAFRSVLFYSSIGDAAAMRRRRNARCSMQASERFSTYLIAFFPAPRSGALTTH